MGTRQRFDLVGKDFARSDAVARVTGAERYTCRWQLQGVACGNAPIVGIPGSTEARYV